MMLEFDLASNFIVQSTTKLNYTKYAWCTAHDTIPMDHTKPNFRRVKFSTKYNLGAEHIVPFSCIMMIPSQISGYIIF